MDRLTVKERLIKERLAAEEAERKAEEAARVEEEMRSKNRKHMGELTAWAWLSEASWEQVQAAADAIGDANKTYLDWSDIERIAPSIKLAVPIRDRGDYVRAIIDTIIKARDDVLRATPF